MIGKKDQSVLTGILYSLFLGSFFGFFVYRHWPRSHPVLGYFVAGVPFVICHFVGMWVVIRKAELDRKIPTSSHALRGRRKRFYDWLNSQERRYSQDFLLELLSASDLARSCYNERP